MKSRQSIKQLKLISLLIILSLFSCEKDEETPADPAGTITTSINYAVDATPISLYRGLAEDALPNFYQYVVVDFGMNSSLNTCSSSIIIKDASFTDYSNIINAGCDFSSIGKVNGLGSITNIPTSGWAASVAIQKGYGYVVRYRHTYNYTTSVLSYYYCRFYVVDWLKNTSGGVIGATIKYANNFE